MQRWFEKRCKNKVLDIADRQMTLALETVNDLEKAVKAVLAGDKEATKLTIKRLFTVEENIDDLRRTVFEELTKVSLPPRDREDIMNLVKNMDVMADHVKDSARNVLVLFDEDIPKEIWQAFYVMSSGLVSAATLLKESLRTLGEDPSKARAISEKVEDEESIVDERYLEIKSLFLKHGDEINPSQLIILKDLLDSMEEAADSCADTGDYVRVLTVSFNSEI